VDFFILIPEKIVKPYDYTVGSIVPDAVIG
jgi:hypothetical protein